MKSTLQEILAKALYHNKKEDYLITYRDMKKYPEISLDDFMNKVDQRTGESIEIPLHRIVMVKYKGAVIWTKVGWKPDEV